MPLTSSARRAIRKLWRLGVNVPAIKFHSSHGYKYGHDLWETEEDLFKSRSLAVKSAIRLLKF